LWPTVRKLTARLQSLGIAKKAAVVCERDLEPERFYEEMVIAGSPDSCVRKIERLRDELGSNYLNALSAFFGFLPLPESHAVAPTAGLRSPAKALC